MEEQQINRILGGVDALMVEGDFSKALELCVSIISVDQTNVNALFRLGLSEIGLGNMDKGIAYLEDIVDKVANPYDIYKNLYFAYERIQQNVLALMAKEKMLEIDGQTIDINSSQDAVRLRRVNRYDINLNGIKRLQDVNSKLFLICRDVTSLVSSGKYKTKALYMPELDNILLEMSKEYIAELPHDENLIYNDEIVVLATEVYAAGGHGKLLNRFVNEFKTHVVFTDIFNNIISGKLKQDNLIDKNVASSFVLIGLTLEDKLKRLLNYVLAIRPKALILLGHHGDALTQICGMTYAKGKRTVFIHHCDHDPALGATIKYGSHLDVTNEILIECEFNNVNSKLLPLTVSDIFGGATKVGVNFKIATCGGEGKFTGLLNGISYVDVVIEILLSDDRYVLYHVGMLSDSYLQLLSSKIREAKLDERRFIYVGTVESVATFFYNNGIDVYFSSFPIGAATTTVEALSVGLPAIYYKSNIDIGSLTSINSIYPTADLEWHELGEIGDILKIAYSNLGYYSNLARNFYKKNNHPEIFSNTIRDIVFNFNNSV